MWLVHNYIGIFVLVGLLFSLFTFLLHTEHMMTMENYSQLFIVISSAPSVRASTFWPNGLVTSVWGWGFDPCKEQSVSPVCQISFQACCWVFSLGILVPPPAPLHNMWYQFLGLLSFLSGYSSFPLLLVRVHSLVSWKPSQVSSTWWQTDNCPSVSHCKQ